ncbi:GNVR domain-containing protein [Aestuariivirga sp.]|uniref:GNVR domain-containing protein n=1 Tax=Aestuariivirga sp. TaxID=2650926 RepID=UPI0035B27A50
MLNRAEGLPESGRGRDMPGRNQQDYLDLDQIFSACRRQWRIAAVTALVFTLLGTAYVLMAQPLYTASTDILIDHNSGKITSDLTLLGDAIESEVSVLSQVEIIKSEKIASSVLDSPGVMQQILEIEGGRGVLSRLRAAIAGMMGAGVDDAASSPDAVRRAAVDLLRQNLSVSRIGQTYVLEVSYTSPSPDLSVRIADAFAVSYLADQLDSKIAVNRQAGDWLQGRIDELRNKLMNADLAVQKFSTEHGLISTGGALVSDQQLGELNTLLIQAQADTAKSQARYDRIQAIVAPGHPDAIVTDALDSEVISGLRKSYMDASKRESEISQTLGRDHESAVRLRAEMAQYKRLMFEELGRISESYRSDLDVAQSREQALRAKADSATGVSKLASAAQVQLRELQREADTYRELYQKVLQNYQETTQLQSFPVNEARIISRALPPDKPSYPRKSLVIALAAVIGGTLGTVIGAARELNDGTLRSGDDVREKLGLDFLGYLAGASSQDKGRRRARRVSLAHITALASGRDVLRAVRIAIDHVPGSAGFRVAGIVSALPGEGKSSVADDLARTLAEQGRRTLLVDADQRARTLTRKLAPQAAAGLTGLVTGSTQLAEAIIPLGGTLCFLPVAAGSDGVSAAEVLPAAQVSAIINEAGSAFDYVIVDLPSIMPVADLRAIVPSVDSVLLVIAWGRTSCKAVENALLAEPALDEKCVGAVLTGVDRHRLGLYERPATREMSLAFRRGQVREPDFHG